MSATERFDFTLDGRSVNAQPGETILQAAQRQGVQIPRLCFSDNLRADGNCRACVVEIDGEERDQGVLLLPRCGPVGLTEGVVGPTEHLPVLRVSLLDDRLNEPDGLLGLAEMGEATGPA